MLGVLCAYCTAEGILIAAIPATRRMASAKYAAVFAKARFARLQLTPLLNTRLPEVVTNVAEVSSSKTEIMCLSLAAIATLPAQELRPMLGALQLALRGTTTANELHG
jgi:hypothetical protein